jgi:radical SAM family uncharacterized protein
LQNKLEQLLGAVTKPGRYLGNELNSVHKDHTGLVTVALAFPDVYDVAMSHFGLQILYHVVNQRADAVAERVYAPWIDFEAELRKAGYPLFALESRRPIREFDLLGFTLQYELSYSNLLNMLDLAGIPLLARERGEDMPLVMVGGPCAFNPEPLADFLDLVVLGEGEEVLLELIDVYKDCKEQGASRRETLQALSRIPGVYVPAFYQVRYHPDGTIAAVEPTAGNPPQIQKRVLGELRPEYYPVKPIVPFVQTVQDRLVLEVFRGCSRGCRFCQAGMIYRPVRERTKDELLELAGEALQNSGYDEVSLMSLSTLDYSDIAELIGDLMERANCEGVKVSLPSLRADSFSVELAKQVQQNKRSGLTLAPEAGSQRLRDVINKQVTEEDLLMAVAGAQASGWEAVKLYFMIGLPTETKEDLEALFELSRKAVYAYQHVGGQGRPIRVTASASSFVPKSWTPFQWEPQDSIYQLVQKQQFLRGLFRRERRISFKYHEAEVSFLEAVLARGDRRLGQVLLRAHRLGCRFDGWSEHFSWERWMQAFADAEIDPTFYANRRRGEHEILPWDHLSPGVDKDYLWQEYQTAVGRSITPDCRFAACSVCGVCMNLPVKTVLSRGGE